MNRARGIFGLQAGEDIKSLTGSLPSSWERQRCRGAAIAADRGAHQPGTLSAGSASAAAARAPRCLRNRAIAPRFACMRSV